MRRSDPLVPDKEDAAVPARRGHRLPALLSVALLALGAAACGDDESAAPESGGGGAGGADVAAAEPAEGATGSFEEVTLTELFANGEAYDGRQVTVSGAVTDADVDGELATPAAFTLGEQVDEDLLVVPTAQADLPTERITDDSVLRVQGRVVDVSQQLAEEAEFLYEEDAVGDEFAFDFTDQVAIAATSVELETP